VCVRERACVLMCIVVCSLYLMHEFVNELSGSNCQVKLSSCLLGRHRRDLCIWEWMNSHLRLEIFNELII